MSKITRNSLKELIRQSINELKEDSGDMDNDGKNEPDDKEFMDNKDKAIKKAIKNESVRKTTVKEVKKWFKTLEENRYKRTYGSDARRVSWMVNNNLSEDYDAMPVSMKKKWPKAAYKRERFLAREFVKHLKGETKLRESIRKIVSGLITEARITFEDTMDAYGFTSAGGDAGVKFYVNNSAKLDAWVMGSKMANVGRLSGKDNKIFKSPMKMGDWMEKKFKLKNKHLDD